MCARVPCCSHVTHIIHTRMAHFDLKLNSNLLREYCRGHVWTLLNSELLFQRAVRCLCVSNGKFDLCTEIQDMFYFCQITFWISLIGKLQNTNSVNWFLPFWKVWILQKHFVICKLFSLSPRSSETTWLHAREWPMELWQGLFHNTSCWEMADLLFSRPMSLWARVPAVSTLKKHTSRQGYIFLSFL